MKTLRCINIIKESIQDESIRGKKRAPTWTSMEKRNAEVKDWIAVTQGTGAGPLSGSRSSRSPWAKASSHQAMAKSIQEQIKAEVKISKECCHFRSTMVVKTSCRNLP